MSSRCRNFLPFVFFSSLFFFLVLITTFAETSSHAGAGKELHHLNNKKFKRNCGWTGCSIRVTQACDIQCQRGRDEQIFVNGEGPNSAPLAT